MVNEYIDFLTLGDPVNGKELCLQYDKNGKIIDECFYNKWSAFSAKSILNG